jgi:hypothetical protein
MKYKMEKGWASPYKKEEKRGGAFKKLLFLVQVQVFSREATPKRKLQTKKTRLTLPF